MLATKWGLRYIPIRRRSEYELTKVDCNWRFYATSEVKTSSKFKCEVSTRDSMSKARSFSSVSTLSLVTWSRDVRRKTHFSVKIYDNMQGSFQFFHARGCIFQKLFLTEWLFGIYALETLLLTGCVNQKQLFQNILEKKKYWRPKPTLRKLDFADRFYVKITLDVRKLRHIIGHNL